MDFQAFSRNFINKIPKILLLLIVLFALSRSKGMLFGYDERPATPNAPTRFDRAFADDFFGRPTLMTTEDSVLYEVRFDASETDPAGYVIVGNQGTNSERGFGGAVPVAIFLDDGMTVRGVKMLGNSETHRFVRRLEAEHFLDRWNGRHLYDPIPQIDASSGATYTSRAVISNVNNTLAALLERKPAPLSWNTFVTNYLGEFAILFVTIMSLACFMAPEATRRLRIPLLILSVAVLGIWQGAFVSLGLLYKWLLFGTSVWVRFGIFAVVLLALLVPLLTNKAFYCSYLCPFGAAQELVGKAWPGKRQIPARMLGASRWVRRGILVAAVILLLLVPRFELADIEPFTAFLIRSAAASAIILAALSLVASLFFRRPWCRLLCPTGELLSILRRPIRYPAFFRRLWGQS